MSAIVADIIKAMEAIAPSCLAEDWDNVGLQVGDINRPVKTIWISLDPSLEVVVAACNSKVDLLITHHPLIFKPLRSIDFSTNIGSIIKMAADNKMAIYSSHTNLDIVSEGLNDILAEFIGLKNIKVLGKHKQHENYKLVIYVPKDYENKILDAIFQTKAGIIGEYSSCTFRNSGKGTFRAGKTATPFIGKKGEINNADEVRIETVVKKKNLSEVIESVRSIHPYETMAYDIYPLLTNERSHGIGRVGELDKKIELKSLALKIKERLRLKSVKVSGNLEVSVKKAAVCTGSGSSMMKYFLLSGAQVYVSGDLRYHDALDVKAANLGLIDIGHFGSEHLIVDVLAKRLGNILAKAGMDLEVKPYRLEIDPFVTL